MTLEWSTMEGESPVIELLRVPPNYCIGESGCLGMQPQSGGKLHPRLNIGKRPIANKYREGKMK